MTDEPLASSSGAGERAHLVVLDGLRGIAAYAVAVFHFSAGEGLPSGWLAVDFFFILSGFVLAQAYGSKLVHGMSFAGFARRRLARLWPMIVVGGGFATFAAVLHDVAHPEDAYGAEFLVKATIASLLLVPWLSHSVYSDRIFPLNPAEWSLFFELWVSLAFGAIARWLRPIWLFALMLLSLLAFWFVGNVGGDDVGDFVSGFPRSSFGFFLGLWINYIWRSGYFRAAKLGLAPLGVVMLGIFALRGVPMPLLYPTSILLFATMIVLAANAEPSATERKVCKHLGALSYPVYLLHYATWYLTTAGLRRAHIGAEVYIPAALITVTLLSYGALRFLDEPIRRRLQGSRALPVHTRQEGHGSDDSASARGSASSQS